MSIANIRTTVGALLQSAETHFAADDQGPITTSASSARRSRGNTSRTTIATAFFSAALFAASGCGNNYRPVLTAISPVGPAGQPSKYAVVISDPNAVDPATGIRSGSLQGLATFVDFSGDTVLITTNIGVDPYYLILNSGGGNAFTLNRDGTVNTFPISLSLIASNVTQSTLLANPTPTSPLPASILPLTSVNYITQPGRDSIAELTGTGPLNLQQELAGVGPDPIYIAGVAAAPRVYALSPSATAGAPGTATPIEVATNTPETPLPVGVNPVYGVMTADTRRAFILNQGSNTVTVIDSQNNRLDTGVANGTIFDPAAVAPVWADFAPTLSELIVLNQGTGGGPGSLSIFSIPLCSATSQPSNPNCDSSNPIDAAGFGSLVAHIPVGKGPLMVGVLQDGTQAYVANQLDSTVSVINLKTNTVSQVIQLPATQNPTFLGVTTGTPTGKVYVISSGLTIGQNGTTAGGATSGSQFMTIIRTDTNQVDTTIPLQGYGIQVRMTAP